MTIVTDSEGFRAARGSNFEAIIAKSEPLEIGATLALNDGLIAPLISGTSGPQKCVLMFHCVEKYHENVLMLHENVVEAVVIGIADEHSGEAPKAFVVLKDASRGVDEIADFASIQKLFPHKYLRGGIEVPEEMPKSASGKTLRRVLRERIGKH
ncbi:hypothetical protein QR680_002926 [Steinernema hermaphroditum]|uniref:AMP-binding enzyme C-terminal domain-containing protein n=1 Tax=Steinernema hermaphroditum TaxID=289476 RepID=A0AA39LJ93_9BILA|nr:hypothetical protein QR680_002926 [Steinernema hermaphroditum]